MSENMRAVAEGRSIDPKTAEHYLNVYVGTASSWTDQIKGLYSNLRRKHSEEEAKLKTRSILSCGILMPALDRTVHPDPERYLDRLRNGYYSQLNERDWFEELSTTVARDLEITEWRNHALSMGVIDPIEYHPFCRQAYKWMVARAEETNVLTDDTREEIERRFKSLVWAYGGAVICNIFTRHDDHLKKVINWRTGYFLERVVFEAYKPEHVYKIKKAELDKTAPQYVRKIKI